ncbi:MAG: trypsin-like peptidase domain-containing protein [Spirochaetes bacterium]|nr:trypsin-like peptidase domain-containing protein [Spirochaetota bacterium]
MKSVIVKLFITGLIFFDIANAAEFEINRSFTGAVEKTKAAVVNIISYTNEGKNSERKLVKSGFGSGTIISEKGYIVTNYHVLRKGSYYHIVLYNGKECEPLSFSDDRYYLFDDKTDIAIMLIDQKDISNINPIIFADSNDLMEGEWVIAIGNPYGLMQSITCGIVSSKGRSDIGFADIEDFIQTDVSINPGNSGGPLINLNGRLVGINTAIRTRSGGFQGISFSIPSNIVRQVAQELVNYRRVRRGWLGFIAKEQSMSGSGGRKILEIVTVINKSPAEECGIEKGDIIKEIDNKQINSLGELVNAVSYKPIGSELNINISREGKLHEFRLILREKNVYKKIQKVLEDIYSIYGIELDRNSITGDVVISYISPMSVGYQSGLKKGDNIFSLNDSTVSSLEEFIRLFKKYRFKISKMEVYRKPDYYTVIFNNY